MIKQNLTLANTSFICFDVKTLVCTEKAWVALKMYYLEKSLKQQTPKISKICIANNFFIRGLWNNLINSRSSALNG